MCRSLAEVELSWVYSTVVATPRTVGLGTVPGERSRRSGAPPASRGAQMPPEGWPSSALHQQGQITPARSVSISQNHRDPSEPFCPCSWLAKLGQEPSQRRHWDQGPILASVFFRHLLSNFSISSYRSVSWGARTDQQADKGSKWENLALPRGLWEAADESVKNRELLQKVRNCLSAVTERWTIAPWDTGIGLKPAGLIFRVQNGCMMQLCKIIEQPETAVNTKLAYTPSLITTGRVKWQPKWCSFAGCLPPKTWRGGGWCLQVLWPEEDSPRDAGQLSSSRLELHYLYPGALLGKKAERTCHNFKISCSPYARSISLLPVSWHNFTALTQQGAFNVCFKEKLPS